MILETKAIMNGLEGKYKNPKTKLGRLVKEGKFHPIIRGLYETDPKANAYMMSVLCSPSYLSFEFALSVHGLIPEGVFAYTCATTGKRRYKKFDTPFGLFLYQDVPEKVFSKGIEMVREGDHICWLATPEKAMCDQLYYIKALENKRYFERLLFDDLRIYEEELDNMDVGFISEISKLYHSLNVSLFSKYMESR